jgi:TonB family protein
MPGHSTAPSELAKLPMMFWIALAAQIAAPAAEPPAGLFRATDLPEYLLRAGPGLWRTAVRINVAVDGKVRGCDVEQSSGRKELDRHTCRILSQRARFQPARIDGVPTIGVYRTVITWVVADAPWRPSRTGNADIDVTVERLPAGLESPTVVKVAFAVHAQGNKSSCEAHHVKGAEHETNRPALVPVACEQIISSYQAIPALDETKNPVLSVQNAVVSFSGPTSN